MAARGVVAQMKRENKANGNAHRQPEKRKSDFRLPSSVVLWDGWAVFLLYFCAGANFFGLWGNLVR